ncbi:short chain dehydrogenase [Candidatus Neomarinimicrobiota bacterium]
MKILIVGGNGTIGSKVSDHFLNEHSVIIAGRTNSDVFVDITDTKSILKMFESLGNVNAIICAAGEAKWELIDNLSEKDFYIGLTSKLMGQVNLVRIGKDYLNPYGSITLTTGIFADKPVKMTTSAAMVNGGIHSFTKAMALELENGIRINVVSPGLVADAYEKYRVFFPGFIPIPMARVVAGYVRSVEGSETGEIIKIYK